MSQFQQNRRKKRTDGQMLIHRTLPGMAGGPKKLSEVRVAVEWPFGEIKTYLKIPRLQNAIKSWFELCCYNFFNV